MLGWCFCNAATRTKPNLFRRFPQHERVPSALRYSSNVVGGMSVTYQGHGQVLSSFTQQYSTYLHDTPAVLERISFVLPYCP